MNNANHRATAAPATVALGGRVYLVAQPTPADELATEFELRRQLLAEARTPIQMIADDIATLRPDLARIALEAAVAQQAGSQGGKAEPTPEAVRFRLLHPDGCRFRFWLLARKHHPDLTLADLVPLITEANVRDVLADLWLALGERASEEEKKTGALPSGSAT